MRKNVSFLLLGAFLSLPILSGCSGANISDIMTQLKGDTATVCATHTDPITGTTVVVRTNYPNTVINGQNCNVNNGMAITNSEANVVIPLPATPATPITPPTPPTPAN